MIHTFIISDVHIINFFRIANGRSHCSIVVASVTGAAFDVAFARTISGGGTSDTSCYALAALPSGDFVVSGSTTGYLATPLTSGSTIGHVFFLQYNFLGGIEWTKQLGAPTLLQ